MEAGSNPSAVSPPWRILHVEASCGWGGQEIRTLTEARGLIGRGHELLLLAPEEAHILRNAPQYGVPAQATPLGKKSLSALWAMRKQLLRFAPHIVVSHSSVDSWLAAVAVRTLAPRPPLLRLRHVSTTVGQDPLTRWLYSKGCDHLVTTGEALKSRLHSENGVAPDHMTSIPTGIDLERFHPGDKSAARHALGLPETAPIVGIVATLRNWKGHVYLFQAMAELIREEPSRHLLVVGDGPQRANLQRLAAELGLTERLIMPGNREDVPLWLQAMDLFVLPSYAEEGVPQALMQAMATGLPVISTPIGSIGELVIAEQTGLLVPPKQSDALASAIRRLLEHPEQRQQLGEGALHHAREHCGLERMLDRMEALFHRLIVPATGSR
ncbi:MAG: glycosyltransferase [Magnetococcales bacterium]|nr:glycosyltransferase [Magnetococcales bacterium]